MDVITTALTAAIADGGTGAAYTMLKARLTGKSPRVDEAIADLEQDAGSLSRQFAVSDALAAAGLAGDRYLRAAARNLVDEVERRRALRPQTAHQPGGVVQVFFATHRQQTGDRHPARQFGAARGELSYGSCEVGIPFAGQEALAALPTLLRPQSRPDPDGNAVLLRSEVTARQPCFTALAEKTGRNAARSALLFVHGYRASFEEAARRTAQIAAALRFSGVPVLYSWPSQGRLSGYAIDETNVEWAAPRLAAFLADLLEQTPVDRLYLLGHGMGCRAMLPAAAALRPDLAARLGEILLVAPDVDAGLFQGELVPALAAGGHRMTLYAAAANSALQEAQHVHAYPRAGDNGAALVVAPGVETVDAGSTDTSLAVWHDAAALPVLADMRQLVARQLPASQRPALRAVDGPTGRYWTLDH